MPMDAIVLIIAFFWGVYLLRSYHKNGTSYQICNSPGGDSAAGASEMPLKQNNFDWENFSEAPCGRDLLGAVDDGQAAVYFVEGVVVGKSQPHEAAAGFHA